MGQFSFHEDEKTVIIRLEGELVMETLHDLRNETNLFLGDNEYENIDIDMSGVPFMDSSGIGFLIGMQKHATELGKKVRLLQPSLPISKLFAMLKLDEFFEIIRD
jgi:anti-anti-sigma factor